MRRLANPYTKLQRTELIQPKRDRFGGGLNVDDAASQLRNDEFPLLENIIAYDKELQGRRGCRKLSDLELPTIAYNNPIRPEDTFSVYKIGNKVYVKNAEEFQTISSLVEGDYIVWSDGTHDQITEIHTTPDTSPNPYPYFISRTSEDRAEEYVPSRAKLYAAAWNRKNKRIVIHIGTKLYWTDTDYTAWNEIRSLAIARLIGASQSKIISVDDTLYVFNDSGVFLVKWDSVGGYYFPINAALPSERINEIVETVTNKYGRRVTYALSRIIGDTRGDRVTTGNILEHETATIDKFQAQQFDTSDVFGSKKIGLGNETFGELFSDSDVSLNLADYQYSNAAFKIGLNGMGDYTVQADTTNLVSIQDFCTRIQTAMRGIFGDAVIFTFTGSGGNARFRLSSGEYNGSTIDTVPAAPSFGTDISGLLNLSSVLKMNSQQYTQPLNYEGAEAPEENEQHTHFSFYGSKNIGAEGRAQGFNPDYLVWLMDVPRICVWRVQKIKNTVYEVEGTIKRYSENDYFRFSNGAEHIGHFLSEEVSGVTTEVFAEESEQIKLFDGDSSSMSIGVVHAVCIGANRCALATQTGNTVSIDGDAQNIYRFKSSDVGKMLFWEDGKTTVITKYLNPVSVEVRGDREISSERACAWDMSTSRTELEIEVTGSSPLYTCAALGAVPESHAYLFDTDGNRIGQVYESDAESETFTASFSNTPDSTMTVYFGGILPRIVRDYTTDEIIDNRRKVAFYVLQTRAFLPIPSSRIGEFVAGFIAVAESNSNKIKYSERSVARPWQIGYYLPGFQEEDTIDDIITHLKKYADRLAIFCKKSTWGITASASATIEDTATGFVARTMPRSQIVDNRGVVHVGSLQDVDINQTIVITHEPAIMIFNGNGFSNANIAQGKVMDFLQSFDNDVASSYDPIGGYILYATTKKQTNTFNRLTAIDGTCLRLAIRKEEGSGWTRFTGTNMVWAEPFVGAFSIEDENDFSRQITIDETTGLLFEINPYKGAEESGLTDSWLDKPTSDFPDGTEIECSLRLPERTGTNETALLEFFEAHCYLREMIGYAFRSSFALDGYIYKNGLPTVLARVLEIPVTGDIVFDRPAKAKRLQIGITFHTSCFRVVKFDEYYNQYDMANAEKPEARKTTYQQYQEDYASSVVWITRGGNPYLNRSTGNTATVTGTISRVEGADGESNSALSFNGEQQIDAIPRAALTGDFTVQFGFEFDADSIPVVDEDELPSGSFWEGMDKIGGDVTFIARNLTAGRFEFVINNVTRAYLTTAGWSNTEVSGAAATSMEVGFDQDRSCWLFFIDGLLVGVVNGNAITDNFTTEIPGTKYKSIASYIHLDNINYRIVFYSRTVNDTSVRATGYIDISGTNNGGEF